MIALALEKMMHRALTAARKYRHQAISVEHLLLYMLEARSIVEHLQKHGVVVDRLRKALAEAVVHTETADGADPEPDSTFQKVIQTAILRAQSKGRKEVSALDVLGVLLDPSYPSIACELIEECGETGSVSRLRANAADGTNSPMAAFKIVAARYVLGTIASWEVPPIADAMLALGVYTPAVHELAEMRDPIRSDLGPVLERAVEEMGLRLPSRDEAVWTLLRYYVSELASGNARGKEGLQPIIDVYYGAALYEATEKYVGDSHGIDSLIGAYYSYEDVSKGSDAESTLEAEVIQQAKAWMGKHCA